MFNWNKKLIGIGCRILLVLFTGAMVALSAGCSSEGSTDGPLTGGGAEETGVFAIKDFVISGVVQTSSLTIVDGRDSILTIVDSFHSPESVVVFELDSNFQKTGRKYNGEVRGIGGSFSIENVKLKTQYALIGAGDENYLSKSDSSWFVLVDLKKEKPISINYFTTLSYRRLLKLVQSGMDFDSAQEQAEQELVRAFDLENYISPFDEMQLTMKNKNLMAIFSMFYHLFGGERKILYVIGEDLAADGVWNNNITLLSDNYDAKDYLQKYLETFLMHNKGYNMEDTYYVLRMLFEYDGEIYDLVEKYMLNTLVSAIYGFGQCSEERQGEIADVPDAEWIPFRTKATLVCDSDFWTLKYDSIEHRVGEMVDNRDGKKYRTTTLFYGDNDSLTWMADNLNFFDTTSARIDEALKANLRGHSMCYDNDNARCDTLGRLYSMTAAWNVDDKKLFDTDGILSESDVDADRLMDYLDTVKVQGICPDGWRLPTDKDWKKMVDLFGDDNIFSALTSGIWNGMNRKKGLDLVDFHGISSGYYNPNEHAEMSFFGRNKDTDLLALSDGYASYVIFPTRNAEKSYPSEVRLDGGFVMAYSEYWKKDEFENAYSVRCVKD